VKVKKEEGDKVKLRGSLLEHGQWRRGGGMAAKSGSGGLHGVRPLERGRELEWSGEVRGALGLELTFYRGWGRAGEAATDSNLWLNGLQVIDGRGWLRRGINLAVKVGGVKVGSW
jgi:hypothetical protein